ncbi:MAG TPA: hypothetical protein VFQ51_03425 [Vicinamibacteria bacterium]|nr:hypothetical protein [Vicinamibacteria bacterium]
MDPEKQRALSEFYREEFLRHLRHLECGGLPSAGHLDRACRKLISDLDRVCWRSDFPAVAETLLQNFDAFTRLSEIAPRQGH